MSPDLGVHFPQDNKRLVRCVNVSPLIHILVSQKAATYIELQTVYSVADAYNLLEMLAVDRHNERVMRQNGNNH